MRGYSSSPQRAVVSGIPLIWFEPEQDSPRKLVIWLPGFGGSKEGVQENLQELARQGYVALSYDPYQHGERRVESQEALRQRVVGNIRRYFWPILAHTAEEVSTIVDWAASKLAVAPQVGMGGVSMGGDISVAAAGVDQRIAAVAACIATPDWLRPGSFEPPGEPDAAAWDSYHRRNPLTHLPLYQHCPAITFQSGAEDRQVPPDGGQRFVSALQEHYRHCPEKLDVTLHEGTAHKFTADMWQNCVRWFDRHLS